MQFLSSVYGIQIVAGALADERGGIGACAVVRAGVGRAGVRRVSIRLGAGEAMPRSRESPPEGDSNVVRRGVQQAQAVPQSGQVVVEGGDLSVGGLAEPLEFDETETVLGLGGFRAVDAGVLGGRAGAPLTGLRGIGSVGCFQPGGPARALNAGRSMPAIRSAEASRRARPRSWWPIVIPSKLVTTSAARSSGSSAAGRAALTLSICRARVTRRYDMGWNKHEEAFLQLNLRSMVTRLPRLLTLTGRLAWEADRAALRLVGAAEIGRGISQAAGLIAVNRVLGHLLDNGTTAERLTQAGPALAVAGGAALVNAVLRALSTAGTGQLETKVERVATERYLAHTANVELAAIEDEEFHKLLDSAQYGAGSARRMVKYCQNVVNAVLSLVAAAGVLAVLHPVLLPLLIAMTLPSAWAALAVARRRYTGWPGSRPVPA